MAAESAAEDYPHEIDEQLTSFDSSVTAVNSMLEKLLSMSRNDLLQKLDPLEQAKLDLMSVYTLNSLFWMYLVTQGINPREHGIKQELERIRTYMNRVKEITDKRKAARLDKGAASRFLRNALYDPEDKESRKTNEHACTHRRRQKHYCFLPSVTGDN
uniref:Nuclear nucleic acid-binding protein C1D n=1 Tax=Kryptolebias marmoratus TaxID=37003 RepID=A0A3Q3B7H8_KRYMA